MGDRSNSDRCRRFAIYYRVRRVRGECVKIIRDPRTITRPAKITNGFLFQLVNRQNGSKLKPTMSAIYDEEAKHTPSHRSSDYSKPVHTIWTDPDVSWNDKSFESTSNKVNKRRSRADCISGLTRSSWISSLSDSG